MPDGRDTRWPAAQLTFDLGQPPRFGRDDYLSTNANAAALAMIERWPDWPDRTILLVGPEGSGKSHLAAIWATHSGAAILDAPGFERADLAALAERPLVVDDADRLGQHEAPLFHLLNLVREHRSWLLMTARSAPDAWGLRTPDLLSRLRLAVQVPIGAPDQDLMRAVLVKLFADRQLVVDEAVVGYLALRLDRSIDAARHVVAELDRTALALNRKVSRPMAAELLGRSGLDEE